MKNFKLTKIVFFICFIVANKSIYAQPTCVNTNCCCGTIQEVILDNGDFETPVMSGVFVGYNAGQMLGSWNVDVGQVDHLNFNYLNWASGNPNGASQFIDLHGLVPGSISNVMNGLVAGVEYTIAIHYAKNFNASSANCNIKIGGGAWLNQSWTATNNGASGWLVKCFSFTAQASSGSIELIGSGPLNNAGMLIDDITIWSCPTDIQPPVNLTSIPSPINIECGDTPPTYIINATDNCSNVSITFSETTSPNGCNSILNRNWMLIDDCNNINNVTQIINIMDNTAPSFTLLPANYTTDCFSNITSEFNNWISSFGNATYTDNCDANLTKTINYTQPPTPSCGQTEVDFIVTDDCGNSKLATASFIVTDDFGPNFINEAEDYQVPCGTANIETEFNNWLNNNASASATDCSPFNFTNDYIVGDPFSNITIIFTATDICGNTNTTSATFSIDLSISDTTFIQSNTCDPNTATTVFQNLTNQFGCDSIVSTSLIYTQIDTLFLNSTTCSPNSSGIFINTYQSSEGCDSIVQTNVSFIPSSYVYLNLTTCDPLLSGTFNYLYSNSQGCDSFVIETITLIPNDTVTLNKTTCLPSEVGIFFQNFQNGFGCDSVVKSIIKLNSSDTTKITINTCDQSLAGTFNSVFQNSQGCDSLVTKSIIFQKQDTTKIKENSCLISTEEINYIKEVNRFGCDSIIQITLSPLKVDTTKITDYSCSISVEEITFIKKQNKFGCDSIIQTTFFPTRLDTTKINLFSCDIGLKQFNYKSLKGCDSIVIQNISYKLSDTTIKKTYTCNKNNSGTFTTQLLNQFGCDSIVFDIVTYVPSDTTLQNGTSCNPDSVGFFIKVIPNKFGCDSVILKTVNFSESDTTKLTFYNCNPEEIGDDINIYKNKFGCDSLVFTRTLLNLIDTVFVTKKTCDLNSVGVFVAKYSTKVGCDSIVVSKVELIKIEPTLIEKFTCNVDSVSEISKTLFSSNGCDSIILFRTLLHKLPTATFELSNFNGFAVSCFDASDGIIIPKLDAIKPVTFNWSNGSNEEKLMNLGKGIYKLIVIDKNQCSISTEFELKAPPEINAIVETMIDSCSLETKEITLSALGGLGPYEYSLNDEPFTFKTNYKNFLIGNNKVIIKDKNGCEAFQEITIKPPLISDVSLGPDIVAIQGEPVEINLVTGIPIDDIKSIIWKSDPPIVCNFCTSILLTLNKNSIIYVEVETKDGCVYKDEITIKVSNKNQEITWANIFNPDFNQNFTIIASDGYIKNINSLKIYSRWGELVFSNLNFPASDLSYGWDGKLNGLKLQPDVYVWVAEVELIDGEIKIINGDITIIK
jgi:hypothetical protein